MRPASQAGARACLTRAGILLVVLPVAPAVLTAWLHPHRPDWAALRADAASPAPQSLSVGEALSAHHDALWLDARPAEQQAAGRVPDSLPLTEDAWDAQLTAVIETWDGQREIIVYCGGEGCHASEAVARRLRRELGFEKIYVLEGGWDAWRARKRSGP